MDRKLQRGEDLLPLPTAAAMAYYYLSGKRLAFEDAAEINLILQRIAHSLANLAPIYAGDPKTAKPRQLEPLDLLYGVFQRGATVLRTSYAEYANLAIRRDDFLMATTILKRAGANFQRK